MTATLSTTEAQGIAESIFGPIEWNGAHGYCRCVGEELHTTGKTPRDLHVVVEPMPNCLPGCYCFHDSCRDVCEAASYKLRSALGKRSPSTDARPLPTRPMPKPKPTYCAEKLERLARKLDGVDAEWFAERSAKRVWNRTPASFLHDLYRDGERVVVFDDYESQGQAVWARQGPPFDARALDTFTTGKRQGVWFLANPVNGELLPNDRGNLSRRSWQNVTAWRYVVIESDKANPAHWLAALAQLPMPIAAITTSGGKSIHALVRIDADSKEHWDEIVDEMKPALITLGADRGALSAVRLTRLPCCERVEKGQRQTLLYLNPNPDASPLAEREAL